MKERGERSQESISWIMDEKIRKQEIKHTKKTKKNKTRVETWKTIYSTEAENERLRELALLHIVRNAIKN